MNKVYYLVFTACIYIHLIQQFEISLTTLTSLTYCEIVPIVYRFSGVFFLLELIFIIFKNEDVFVDNNRR